MHVSHRRFDKACTVVVLAMRRRLWWRRRWRASRTRHATSSGATSSSKRSGSGSARRATASTSKCRWSAPAATGRALASLWTRFVPSIGCASVRVRLKRRLFHKRLYVLYSVDALACCDRGIRAPSRREHHLSGEPTGELVVHSQVGHLRYRGLLLAIALK